MVFNPDGTKLFVAGDQLNAVSELALSTPYDISTATFTAGLYVNSEESNINGLAFDDGAAVDPGRKLYRDSDNEVVAGVCSGIASYLGITTESLSRIRKELVHN